MQLEKIRSADTQVRWQDEEDCYQCPSCKLDFTVTRRKVCLSFFRELKTLDSKVLSMGYEKFILFVV